MAWVCSTRQKKKGISLLLYGRRWINSSGRTCKGIRASSGSSRSDAKVVCGASKRGGACKEHEAIDGVDGGETETIFHCFVSPSTKAKTNLRVFPFLRAKHFLRVPRDCHPPSQRTQFATLAVEEELQPLENGGHWKPLRTTLLKNRNN
ncbi:hypothetical protein H6P81_020029 [Aristolochia fimbriata]|uniref:Uncharacterized protein n=1 Tax=Aristolochia fimbriata TaxID=158543 RepID=A0AAV7DTL8_ARIFI|nr:hypothetical protein H6P81_020029 [Aristolochia fimbriata]